MLNKDASVFLLLKAFVTDVNPITVKGTCSIVFMTGSVNTVGATGFFTPLSVTGRYTILTHRSSKEGFASFCAIPIVITTNRIHTTLATSLLTANSPKSRLTPTITRSDIFVTRSHITIRGALVLTGLSPVTSYACVTFTICIASVPETFCAASINIYFTDFQHRPSLAHIFRCIIRGFYDDITGCLCTMNVNHSKGRGWWCGGVRVASNPLWC